MHDSVLSGHLGAQKTKEKLSHCYYWYNLKQDIRWCIEKCDICAVDKPPAKIPKAPMGHIRSSAPWDTLALDYLGPFPVTPRGNRYILVMNDTFTKYFEVLAVPNQKAEDCTRHIVNDFVSCWGTSLHIHSDQGATFESSVSGPVLALVCEEDPH